MCDTRWADAANRLDIVERASRIHAGTYVIEADMRDSVAIRVDTLSDFRRRGV